VTLSQWHFLIALRVLGGPASNSASSGEAEPRDLVRSEAPRCECRLKCQPSKHYRAQARTHAICGCRYAAAVEASSRAQSLLWTVVSHFETAEYHFYGALSRAALCDSAPAGERRQHMEALAAHHKQLQSWADNCPDNFENRAALVGAEIARIEGRTLGRSGSPMAVILCPLLLICITWGTSNVV
jgi:hypothetical protein